MNEDKIYELIKPYIKNNTLSYKAFFGVFSFLRKSDQYEVINLIEDKFNIRVIDDESVEAESESVDVSDMDIDPETDAEFEELYDKGAFVNPNYPQRTELNTKQSNEQLCRLIQEGDELAKEELCIKNKRLVYKYAYAYNKFYNHKLEFQDLTQAGFMGLLKAAEMFNFNKGTRFSTYSTYWIKQHISREIMNTGHTIRLPVHMFEIVNKLQRIENLLQDDLKRDPTVEELAEAMGVEPAKIRELIIISEQIKATPSLDAKAKDESGTPIWELIEDTMVEPTEAMSERIALYEIFDKALKQLGGREEKVLRLRTGFDDGVNRTLEEVGQMMGVTRERVRQIESRGLTKLKPILRHQDLHLFFE